MNISAVAVASKDMKRTVEFYTLLGFDFSGVDITEKHVEPNVKDGQARLMIDTTEFMEEMNGKAPVPGNHSSFAIEYDSAEEVNEIAEKIKEAGFEIVKAPWDAFWGQRYAIVRDPDGYEVDLFASLSD